MQTELEVLKRSKGYLSNARQLQETLQAHEDEAIQKMTNCTDFGFRRPKLEDLTPADYVRAHYGNDVASVLKEMAPVKTPSLRFLFWGVGAALVILCWAIAFTDFGLMAAPILSLVGIGLIVMGVLKHLNLKRYNTWLKNKELHQATAEKGVLEATEIIKDLNEKSAPVFSQLQLVTEQIRQDEEGKALMGNYYALPYVTEMVSYLSGGFSWKEALTQFEEHRHRERMETHEWEQARAQEEQVRLQKAQLSEMKRQTEAANKSAAKNTNFEQRRMCSSCVHLLNCRRPKTINCPSYLPKK